MVDCPTCNREFETTRGVRVHHSQVHGERLPNRTCGHCEESFYCEHEKQYCSGDCRDAAVSFTGSDNPNYRDAKESTECTLCGHVFEYYPSEKDGVFCPRCVETETWQEPPCLQADDHPQWNGGRLEVACDRCGEPVERYPSNVNEVVVCGEECRSAWLAEAFTGEGHPNWRGGGNGPYGEGWNAVREAALERDGYECVLCGTGPETLGRNPAVHHILPVRWYVEAPEYEKTDAHALENVVTLCPPCHRGADFGSIDRDRLVAETGTSARPDGPDPSVLES